ncbi:MAG: peptidoglycan-binding protein [Oscillospiraceae bacterium]|nr:peptidoglycan-binding protein [Oscillospiraceae bacterium]
MRSDVPEIIYARVTAAGFTTEAACALLAQIQKESLFEPTNLEDTRNKSLGMTDAQYTAAVDSGTYTNFVNDAAGYGIAQWTEKDRKRNYLNYFRARGKSIGDLETQIAFLIWEMKACFGGIWKQCLSSHDLYALTKVLLYTWENPQEKEENLKIRYGYAQNWYQKYSVRGATEKEKIQMTRAEAIDKVVNIAVAELGYREKASNANLDDKTAHAGGANWTKYARDLAKTNWYNGNKNGYAWCDVFVDWCFWKAFGDPVGRNMICQPTGSAGAGCLYSAQYYKQAGRWYSYPQKGDQIFFSYSAGEYSHTGLVEKVEGSTVTTIEGNTSDQVGRRTYPIGSNVIAGYGRPKWELAANASETSVPEVSETQSTAAASYELLKYGAFGESVRKLQQMLIDLGYDVGSDGADGDFGTNTEKAVRKFQTDNNLFVDGEVGDETWPALEAAASAKGKATQTVQQTTVVKVSEYWPPRMPLKVGMKGKDVEVMTALLKARGFDIHYVTDEFGTFAEERLKEFQKAYGLEPSGIADKPTWVELTKF